MSAQKTCPRIVLVDDEEFTHEMVDLVLRESLRRYTLAKFLNRDEAWQELLRGGGREGAPPLSRPRLPQPCGGRVGAYAGTEPPVRPTPNSQSRARED
jgi:hypothetical protein